MDDEELITVEIEFLCGKKQEVSQPAYCWAVEGFTPFFMCLNHPLPGCPGMSDCAYFKEWYEDYMNSAIIEDVGGHNISAALRLSKKQGYFK